MNPKELLQAIEMKKQLLSALFMKEGQVVPDVAAIIDTDDLYRPEHRLVFQAILRLCAKGEPIDYIAVEEERRKSGDVDKIDHLYLPHLIDATFTTAHAQYHARLLDILEQHNTPMSIAAKNYTMLRIQEIILHRQLTPTITFFDVFKKFRIEKANSEIKPRIREFMVAFFEHLKKAGVVKSFKVVKTRQHLLRYQVPAPQKVPIYNF